MTAPGGTLAAGLIAAALAFAPAASAADPQTLRMASVTPEGSAWARELHAAGREIAASTREQVLVKWYLSGIAGDELAMHDRVQRDQLDGILSGGMLCQRLAPSLRAAGTVARFRDRGEASYILQKLKPIVDAEFDKAGYVNVAEAGMGFSVIFSRTPVRTMADLKRLHPWMWGLDEVLKTQLFAMGLAPAPLPVEGSGRAYDEGKIDGFISVPSAALAFQWSAQTRYVTNLRVGYLAGCMLVSRRAWDTLGHDDQALITSAAAKLQVRVEETARMSDEMLLGGLFARQGLQAMPASPTLQAEFNAAARDALKSVEKLAPPGLLDKVSEWLAEYRNNHRAEKR
ncbi:MAG: Extracellular solute-binding protein family 7 [Myxococcales bacterium]|nr:Extracellular solute-binding protein family 7 [Myxococcales bacterium]